jgi:OPA family glycerol-3-phosphate transporter-like MFS transporter
MANIVLGFVVQQFGWNVGFILLTVISICAMLSFILTWNKRGQTEAK